MTRSHGERTWRPGRRPLSSELIAVPCACSPRPAAAELTYRGRSLKLGCGRLPRHTEYGHSGSTVLAENPGLVSAARRLYGRQARAQPRRDWQKTSWCWEGPASPPPALPPFVAGHMPAPISHCCAAWGRGGPASTSLPARRHSDDAFQEMRLRAQPHPNLPAPLAACDRSRS